MSETSATSAAGARVLVSQYLTLTDHILRHLPPHARADIRAELESHIAGSIASGDPAAGADERARVALQQLGEPREYLKPLIADYLLERGAETAHPVRIAAGLVAQLSRGVARGAVAFFYLLGYSVSLVLMLMGALKLFLPHLIGAFVGPSGAFFVGIVRHPVAAREVLGYWIVPIGLGSGAGLYGLLTLALRRTQKRGVGRAN